MLLVHKADLLIGEDRLIDETGEDRLIDETGERADRKSVV